MSTRPAAIAGTFYPADPSALARLLDHCWQNRAPGQFGPPKAMIVPHAGLVYSGPIAASAYATLTPVAESIRRVVLLGPSHHYGFDGFAIPATSRWATPLGDIELDGAALAHLAMRPNVQVSDQIHGREHSLEVHLPFLQRTLRNFRLVPIAVGRVEPKTGGQLLRELWGGDETLIVVSSDLSHFFDQATAQAVDRRSSDVIESMNAADAMAVDACGRHPISCLLAEAQRRGMKMQTIDLRTSADTAGDPQRVVGYGSYLFWTTEEAS